MIRLSGDYGWLTGVLLYWTSGHWAVDRLVLPAYIFSGITPVSGSGESFKQTLFYLFIICSINSQRRFFGKCSCVLLVNLSVCVEKCQRFQNRIRFDELLYSAVNLHDVFGQMAHSYCEILSIFLVYLPLMSALPARVKACLNRYSGIP